jgi:hypothetical protein
MEQFLQIILIQVIGADPIRAKPVVDWCDRNHPVPQAHGIGILCLINDPC